MARRIYWVSYPEKDKQGKINDFQTLLDWAYEDTVGYSETGVQYVQSQPFSVDFCEEDIILEDEEAAKEYILDEMYPDYSGFDLRAYDMHNCAVRFYKEVSKESKKYTISPNMHRVASASFDDIDKYINYLEEYHWCQLSALDKILKDKVYFNALKIYFKEGLAKLSWLKSKINEGSIRDVTEESVRDFLEVLKTATSVEEIPSDLRYYDRLFNFVPPESFTELLRKVSRKIADFTGDYFYYRSWSDFMYDTIDINNLLSKVKEENSSTSSEDNKEVYWLMYIEKRV